MSEKKKLAVGVNLLLSVIVLFVGVVCFYPATATVSEEEAILRHGDRSGNKVSLMINVYQNTPVVEGMLSTLAERGKKATFFLGGCWADDNTQTVQKMSEHGMEIGSHGYFHKDCPSLSARELSDEITLSRTLIVKQTGRDITLFAPPSGAYDDATVEECRRQGLALVLWSRDTVDWRDHDEAIIFSRATKGVTGGEFILMHPTSETLSALPKILDYYDAVGLQCATVTENVTYGG